MLVFHLELSLYMEYHEKIEEKWLRKEMDLDRKHKEISAEREELLSRHKVRLLSRENKVKLLGKDLEIAKSRNDKLIEDVELFERGMQARQKQHGVDGELEVLKDRYWEMVQRELSSL